MAKNSHMSDAEFYGRSFFFGALILLILLWGLPAIHYGTLSPCEMAKKEIMRQEIEDQLDVMGGSIGDATGGAIGLALGERVVDSYLASMSLQECISALVEARSDTQGPGR